MKTDLPNFRGRFTWRGRGVDALRAQSDCSMTGFSSSSLRYSGAEPIGASRTGRCRNVIDAKAPIQEPKAAKQTYTQLLV